MKWLRRILIALVVIVLAVVGAGMATAQRSEHPVGFQAMQAKGADGKAFAVSVWYPTSSGTRPTTMLGPVVMSVAPDGDVKGQKLPLVVISHGNGGGPGSHADLAMALASAGYIVAAPMHAGDNFLDESLASSATLFNERNRQLRATVDAMLKDWPVHDHIDAARIGAFGMSAGGLTVLSAIGGQPDLRSVASHCATTPEFVCTLLKQVNSGILKPDLAAEAFVADARIKAAVVAAPGLGFTFGAHGLDQVQVPVQLWSGDLDSTVPYASNAKLVQDALGARAEFHAVAGAGHTSFLTPCGLLAPPAICADQGAFDRKAFHADMNRSVIAFFDKAMKAP
ncbi:MAG: dienelactone hydrolase family protein [Pseudomonadota bacterium]